MANLKTDFIQSNLELLILNSLALGSMHGWDICQSIQRMTPRELLVNQGYLYPVLYSLEKQGLISSEWRSMGYSRKIKFYELTQKGEKKLEKLRESAILMV